MLLRYLIKRLVAPEIILHKFPQTRPEDMDGFAESCNWKWRFQLY